MAQVTALMPEGRQRYYNNDGTPCAGGKLWTYAAGTAALKATYSDVDGTIPNANPVVLDAHGEAIVYWAGAYKVDLKQADGLQVTGYPVDNLKTDPAGLWSVFATLLTAAGASLVGFLQAGAGAILRTVQAELRETVKVTQFGADPTGVNSSSNALDAAVVALGAAGGTVKFPPGTYKLTRKHTISTPVILKGAGRAAYLANYAARLLKAGDFVAIEFAQGSAFGGMRDITLDRTGADTSDGVYVTSGRIDINRVTIQNQGRHGLNIYNANCSQFHGLQIIGCVQDAVYIEGNAVSPDVNGMLFTGLDLRSNGRHGVNQVNGFSNTFIAPSNQGNAGYGLNFNGDNNIVTGAYSENNTLGFLNFGAGADRNKVGFGIVSDYLAPPANPSGTNTYNLPSDSRSFDIFGTVGVQTELQLGTPGGGAPGYLSFKDTGATYQLTLEGTGGSVVVPVRSSGGGTLTLDVQALSINASTAPALLGAWVNFGGSRKVAGYYKDRFGIVSLEGTVKSGVLGTAIMQLPATFRPGGRQRFAVVTLAGAVQTFGSVIVDSDGNVYGDSGGTTEFCLDGINFKGVP